MKLSKLLLLLIVILPAFVATLPLFRKEFIPTHDGEYHIIRFSEFYSMLSAGIAFPRWTPNLNSGYGIPLFNFHYPFPNYAGSLFHALGYSFVDSFKLSLALGYLFAVIFCYFWLSKMFSPGAALTGTIVFSFVPYIFVDIYVRGSIGEIYALTFTLLALLCIEYGNGALLAIALSGIVLSHNISTLIFAPLIVGYIIIRRKNLIWFACLAVGLTTYFWLPALLEAHLMVGLNSVNFRDHFPQIVQLIIPSWGTGFSRPGYAYDELSFQIGIVVLGILVWTLLKIRSDGSKMTKLTLFFLILSFLYIFLMVSKSQFIWSFFSFLQFIQYPWRLLSIFPIVAAFLVAVRIDFQKKYKALLVIIISIASIVLSYSYSRPVEYKVRTDQYYLSKKEFTDGTSSLGNSFATIWSPWKQIRPEKRAEIIRGNATIAVDRLNPVKYSFVAKAQEPSTARFNISYYPGWVVRINNSQTKIDYSTSGVIQFNIPQGISTGTVVFEETTQRAFADTLSIASVLVLITMYFKHSNTNKLKI